MNDTHVEDDLLQRYYDGDLRGSSALSVSNHIEGCEQCRARHRALCQLHELVVLAVEQSAAEVDFEAAFGRIERGVREQAALPFWERWRVKVRELVEQRPEQLWAPALGAALAAGVLVFVLRNGEPNAGQPQPAARNAPPPVAAAAPERAAPAKPGSLPTDALALANTEVVQVDFGTNAGTVYEIALSDGVSTPVVWINDDVIQ